MRPSVPATITSIAIIVATALCLSGCAEGGADKPTPEAAKKFLKLRGYNFDDQSFLSAAAAGDAMAVNGFLAAGINLNVADKIDGDTALIAAASRGDLPIVKVLLENHADVNIKNKNGWTALLLAFQHDRNDVADALIAEQSLEVNAEPPSGMSALMLAVWNHREAAVQTLLQRGADINHQDKDGDTSLHGAAFLGDLTNLQILLQQGANPGRGRPNKRCRRRYCGGLGR